MIKRLFYTILVGMLMLLSSCSETPSADEITKSKKEIITDLNQLYTDGFITQQNANDAIANIVSFEQKNFIGQYWWVVLFIFVSISLITTFILLTDSEEEHLAQPIKKSNAYRVVAFVGFLGGHNIYLKKHNWIGVFTLILTIVFFFLELQVCDVFLRHTKCFLHIKHKLYLLRRNGDILLVASYVNYLIYH